MRRSPSTIGSYSTDSSFLLTDNRPQFVNNLFDSLWTFLGVININTTAYHPQINGQTERNNKAIATRRCHYAEHQRDWDLFVQLLTFAYNTQDHCTTEKTPSSLVLSRQPPGPTKFVSPRALPTDANGENSPKMLRLRLLSRIAGVQHNANKRTKAA